MWPGAPRSVPDGSFLARAASVLFLVRAQVASRLSILCSSRRRRTAHLASLDATIELNHPLSAGAADGRAGSRRAALAWVTRVVNACRPPPSLAFGSSPIVGVRRQPPADPSRVCFGSAGRVHVRTERPLVFMLCVPNPSAMFRTWFRRSYHGRWRRVSKTRRKWPLIQEPPHPCRALG